MRALSTVVVILGVGCASTSATGRLPAHLITATGVAVPGRPVGLRSTDGVHFTETEVAVEMDRVPGPVRALRSSSCPNREGTTRYSEREIDGAPAYSVYVGEGPRACAVTARSNGVRLRVDEALDPASLPAPVSHTIEGVFHNDYTIAEAWRRTSDAEGERIELTVRKRGQEYILVMTPGGDVRLRMRRYPAILDVPDR